MSQDLGFRVQVSGFRVWGLGFRVYRLNRSVSVEWSVCSCGTQSQFGVQVLGADFLGFIRVWKAFIALILFFLGFWVFGFRYLGDNLLNGTMPGQLSTLRQLKWLWVIHILFFLFSFFSRFFPDIFRSKIRKTKQPQKNQKIPKNPNACVCLGYRLFTFFFFFFFPDICVQCSTQERSDWFLVYTYVFGFFWSSYFKCFFSGVYWF